MLPVIDIGSAIILSAALATQYAPEAPTSLIKATFGLLIPLTAFLISSEPTTEPPGLFMSKIIPLTLLSSFAFSINLTIVSGLKLLSSKYLELVPIGPSILITAILFWKSTVTASLDAA